MSPTQTLAIEGELSIYRAAELRQWFHTAVPRGGELHVSLTDVSEVDTAGAQLLLVGKRLARERGCALVYTDHSPPVLALMELFDLADRLGDPIVRPAAAPQRKGKK